MRLATRSLRCWTRSGASTAAAALAFHAVLALVALAVTAFAAGVDLWGMDAAQGRLASRLNLWVGLVLGHQVESWLGWTWQQPHRDGAAAFGAVILILTLASATLAWRRVLNAMSANLLPRMALRAVPSSLLAALSAVAAFSIVAAGSFVVTTALAVQATATPELAIPVILIDLPASAACLALAIAALLRLVPDESPSRGAAWIGAGAAAVVLAAAKEWAAWSLVTSPPTGVGLAVAILLGVLGVYLAVHVVLMAASLASSIDEARTGRAAAAHRAAQPASPVEQPKPVLTAQAPSLAHARTLTRVTPLPGRRRASGPSAGASAASGTSAGIPSASNAGGSAILIRFPDVRKRAHREPAG